MKILCGLGNPGTEYEKTRHNVGFMVCDILSARHGISFSSKKFSGWFAGGTIFGEKILLLKPLTYMNRSGQSVGPAVHFYKLLTSDLVVIHDDVDLALGRVKIKVGGGTAGHKGLRSLVDSLADENFIRIRVGVGRPADSRMDIADFVLSKLSSGEETLFRSSLDQACDAVEAVIKDGPISAMNEFNRITDE